MRYTSNYYYCICNMKLYALPVQDSLGGWRSFCYHSGLATLSEGYDPFTDPYQNFLKVDNHGGQSMTSVTWRWIPGSGDTWCQCQRIILTLWPWHLWNMDKHNDNDGIKIKTKIIVSTHKYIEVKYIEVIIFACTNTSKYPVLTTGITSYHIICFHFQ